MAIESGGVFTVRPHHLLNLQQDREIYRKYGARDISDARTYMFIGLREQVYGAIEPTGSVLPEDTAYYQDVFGATAGTAVKSVFARAQILQDLMHNPTGTPVVVASQKDRICLEACAVGNHCKAISPAENEYVEEFVDDANRTGIDYSFTHGLYKVQTTLGGLRKVLDYRSRGKVLDAFSKYMLLPDATPEYHSEYLRGRTNFSEAFAVT